MFDFLFNEIKVVDVLYQTASDVDDSLMQR